MSELGIEQFFRTDGSLIHIPAKNNKKVAVLQEIAKDFETGVMYPEKTLNEIISKYHSDTAAIRRHMIEFNILQRNKESVYWLK